MTDTSQLPVIIVGAGAIGLSIAWRLASQGERVIVLERDEAGRATSWLSAGMLAPDTEIGFEELPLYRLSRESLRRWPDFARKLEADSQMQVDYRTEGTLLVADDRDSMEALRRLYHFQKEQGLPVEWINGEEAREIEPFLAPRLTGAVFSPSDHQVDNRRLVKALQTAFLNLGGMLHEHTPVAQVVPDERTPVAVTSDGQQFTGKTIVLAAGPWSRQIEGLTDESRPPIRPVKGQMIELKVEPPFELQHVIRGPRTYLAPKSDGRLLVGATSEEMGFDTSVTAGGLFSILEGAWEVVPGILDLDVTDSWAGLRPASRDHAPILGYANAPGIVFATGHFRHGILLTPVTADEISRLILSGETSPLIYPFSPKRFR